MGLFISIPVSVQGDDGKYYQEDIDVIIHKKNGGEDSLEIVDFDIDAAVAAEALGMDDYDIELGLYRQYKTEGLDRYIRDLPSLLDDAFEEQGYDVFTDEAFSRDDFLNTVGQNIRDNIGSISRNIEFLKDAVNDKKYDKDEFVEDLIEGLKTLVDTDRFVQPEEKLIPHFLHPLVQMLPEEKFVFNTEKPWDEYSENDERRWNIGHNIEINDEHIISWNSNFEIVIIDPMTFEMEFRDLCTHYDDPETYCPPPAATFIMDYMGWSYPPVPELEGPEAPEADDDGLFGVEYTKTLYEYTRFEGSSSVSAIKTGQSATTLVQYETLNEAEEAAELSRNIMEMRGIDDEYEITVVAYDEDAEEWNPIGIAE